VTLAAEITTPAALGPVERQRWAALRASDGSYSSPFFALTFADAVGAARTDCRIAVLREHGEIAGFFPFHAEARGRARPIGRRLADYQGVIVDRSLRWDAADLLRACRLRSFAFDHLVEGQDGFRRNVASLAASPTIDLTEGVAGPREIVIKRRRVERRDGLHFVWHDPTPEALAALVRWKSEQYRSTGVFDLFSRAWVVEILARLHATQADDLQGVLSCLYTDDGLRAVHFGLRSGRVLHSWFPAYDRSFAKHSPGLLLLSCVAEEATARGMQTLDLGRGEEPYKRRFANGARTVGAGFVVAGRHSAAGTRLARGLWTMALRSPFYHRVHRLRQRWELG
jgi:CelD/BcsL family acetyltransferase involved in cellulose biosynthesis